MKRKRSIVRNPTPLHLGGGDTERLYLHDLRFEMPNSQEVIVSKAVISGIDMQDLIARSRARYHLVGFFCRPGHRVLDFPCGSGYSSEILKPLGVIYDGIEFDPITVEYASRLYGDNKTKFRVGDLTLPKIQPSSYDVVACIEGLEHIETKYQDKLVASFKKGLRPGGVLIISSPENVTGTSGRSPHNKYHLGELTREDFLSLLKRHFPLANIEFLTHRAFLSTKVWANCFYGICHNPASD